MAKISKIFILLLIICFQTPIIAQKLTKNNLEKVRLRLKYKHSFQFAGYYAALSQGYYLKEGLAVTISRFKNSQNAVTEVLNGDAEYGIWDSELLNMRLSGKPLVILAVIFQHSPLIILTRKDSQINSPSDLIGKRMMTRQNQINPQLHAMLLNEGLSINGIIRTKHSWNTKDLVRGKTDATIAYLTDQPNRMKMLGVEPSIIRPINYGIDFYGDCLFTTKNEINKHPKRVAAFRRASLKGWKYALNHINELTKQIIKMPGVKDRGITIQHLLYEARQMKKLIFPKLIEIGHSNPGRWKHIADTYVRLGILKTNYSLKGLIYDPNPVKNLWWLYTLLGLLFGTIIVTIFAYVWNKTLKKQVKQRTEKVDIANEQLKKSESYAKTLFADSATPLVVMNAKTFKYTDCNQAAINIYGVDSKENLIGMTPLDVSTKTQYDGSDSTIKAKEYISTALKNGSVIFEWRHQRPSGEIWDGEVQLMAIGEDKDRFLQFSLLDITQRKKDEKKRIELKEQLAHHSKMDAIGQLAGGVAHDFNNMLAGIIGAAQLLKLPKRKLDEKSLKYTEMIIQSVTRAADLTAKLLAFGRKGEIGTTAIDLHSIIDDAQAILKRTIDKRIKMIIKKEATLHTIIGDSSALQNALMNLVINASQAMPDGGVLKISTKNINLNEQYCEESDFKINPGDFVDIEIQDTGLGIPHENLKKIFEPFFTTKKQGKGTGLGLSAVYGIVQDHQGSIIVNSKSKIGTTFHIYLPCSKETIVRIEDEAVTLSGSGQILLVDDEELIRTIGKQLLEDIGYKVILASNGKQAVKIFKEQHTQIDLIVMDMMMPEMNGQEAFYKMQEIDKSCKIVISSGFSKDKSLQELTKNGLAGYIRKPFKINDFIRLLDKILH